MWNLENRVLHNWYLHLMRWIVVLWWNFWLPHCRWSIWNDGWSWRCRRAPWARLHLWMLWAVREWQCRHDAVFFSTTICLMVDLVGIKICLCFGCDSGQNQQRFQKALSAMYVYSLGGNFKSIQLICSDHYGQTKIT